MSTTIEAPENGLAEIGNKISTGLAAFEVKKTELEELKKEVEGLDITSINDKASIKTVSEARKRLKAARIEIEKDAKAMRDGLTERSRYISQKEKELVDIIEPTEKELLKKEKWVKDENDRIEREALEAEQKKTQDRIDRLAAYDCEINLVHLKSLPDEEFEKVVVSAKKQFDIEQAEKVEQDRIKEEERKELEQLRQQKQESDRIIKEQQDKIEADRLEKERRDKEDADRESENIRKEAQEKLDAEAKLVQKRISELIDIGFTQYGKDEWTAPEKYLVIISDIKEMDADKWSAYINEVGPKIKAYKDREEKEASDKAIADKKTADEESARLENERIAQASDKEKFQTIISQIEALNYPEMKSAKHKKLLTEVKELQAKVIAHIKLKS